LDVKRPLAAELAARFVLSPNSVAQFAAVERPVHVLAHWSYEYSGDVIAVESQAHLDAVTYEPR
jgi:hypothetical protein